ncbi:MAG TPA: AI-2E family transporter [Beijerinckiaceae bacterium]|nr:AI-2E family transporter [Beijerinckiaceae bacterium]
MRAVRPDQADSAPDQDVVTEPSYVEKALGLVLLLVLAVGCILVLSPFLSAILLAIPLCVSTWPLFGRVQQVLDGRRTAAALLTTLIIAAVLVAPLVVLGMNLADDIARLNIAVHSAIERGLPPPPWLENVPMVGAEAKRLWLQISQGRAELRATLAPYLGPIRTWALQQGASLLGGTLQVALSVFLLFFLYRDGAYAEARLKEAMSRLGGWRARHVLEEGGGTIRSVVNGVVGTAVIQGILLGVSFWIAGIPGAIVLGALAVILTLMPLGLVVLWLPAALWLLSQDQTGWAIFVFAWNGLFVGMLDNLLRPYLISRGAKLPTVLIFFGVLGGVLTFGVVGVFLGPVLLAVAYRLFQDWGAGGEGET